jgi:hypothetical protein
MTQRIQNAIAKAKQAKCHVRRLVGRTYEVLTPKGRRYTVRCDEHEGARYVVCNCKAGATGQPCYHIIGVALLDTALAAQRRGH